jgi:hypothetical protein
MEQLKVMPPPIIVKALYAPDDRAYLREFLVSRKIDLDVGMWRLHAHITGLVHANRGRIIRETGITGIYVDQLSVRNLYHFFDGRRTDDERVAILDAYVQLSDEGPRPIITQY